MKTAEPKKNKNEGTLYVISAPSGAGKTSLVNALIESMDKICVSISHTTRQKRAGEIEGHHYYFVSQEKFQALIQTNAFLEYAQVFQQDYYGTSRDFVEKKLSQGIDVVLEIDWQGAEHIRKIFQKVTTIFILPPSCETLIERLRKRARDDENIIASRMKQAKNEMSHYSSFDYVVINDQFEAALADLKSIVTATRLREPYQSKKYTTLIKELLS